MSVRCWELVTPDETTVLAKTLFDAIVMKEGQCDGRLSYASSANESYRQEALGETNDFLDQPVASETGPRRRGR